MDFDSLFKINWDTEGILEKYPQFNHIFCQSKANIKPIALMEMLFAVLKEKSHNYFFERMILVDRSHPDLKHPNRLMDVFIQNLSPLDVFNNLIFDVTVNLNDNGEREMYSTPIKGKGFYTLFESELSSDFEFDKKIKKYHEFSKILKTKKLVDVIEFIDKEFSKNPFCIDKTHFIFSTEDFPEHYPVRENFYKKKQYFKELPEKNSLESNFLNFKKRV